MHFNVWTWSKPLVGRICTHRYLDRSPVFFTDLCCIASHPWSWYVPRTIQVGRDFFRSVGPTVLLKENQQDQVAQVQLHFAFLCRRSTASLCHLGLCLTNFTVKTQFLMFRGNQLCFCVYPLPLVLTLGDTENILASSSSFLLGVYMCQEDPPEPSFL